MISSTTDSTSARMVTMRGWTVAGIITQCSSARYMGAVMTSALMPTRPLRLLRRRPHALATKMVTTAGTMATYQPMSISVTTSCIIAKTVTTPRLILARTITHFKSAKCRVVATMSVSMPIHLQPLLRHHESAQGARILENTAATTIWFQATWKTEFCIRAIMAITNVTLTART